MKERKKEKPTKEKTLITTKEIKKGGIKEKIKNN